MSAGIEVDELKRRLGLEPLPLEGGFYRETYRSSLRIDRPGLPDGYRGDRDLATAIYYLLTPNEVSAMHRLSGDETYHFYLGDPVELLLLHADGGSETVLLGNDLRRGMHVQWTVRGGCWQGARLVPGGRFALMGTTMAPGFDLRDFEVGRQAELLRGYPDCAERIRDLTPRSAGNTEQP